jgi:hypothetical protein
MFIDKRLTFFDNANVATENGTYSNDYIDLQNNNCEWGDGRPLHCIMMVNENFANADNSAATAQPIIQDSDNGSAWNNVVSGKNYNYNDAVAGTTLLDIPLPRSTRRYIRAAIQIGNNMTGGNATAALYL